MFIYLYVLKGNNLHSHAIAWGSGSGQQSVTTTGTKNDKGFKKNPIEIFIVYQK